jgi:dienelactone hydrolase
MTSVYAAEPDELLSTPVAAAFGSQPTVWNLRLNPDGGKLSFLQAGADDRTVLIVADLENGGGNPVMASDPQSFDIDWCDWANEERILCGVRFRAPINGIIYSATRLLGVNADGSDLTELVQQDRRNSWGQIRGENVVSLNQDRVVDWLPEDPDHVLIQVPTPSGNAVGRIDIYSGRVTPEERMSEGIVEWLSDGHGAVRLYWEVADGIQRWYVRDTADSPWSLLHEAGLNESGDQFSPVGFGQDRGELLFFDELDGRTALYRLNLNDKARSVVFAHPSSDVSGIYQYGKYKRPGATEYMEDQAWRHVFDDALRQVQTRLAGQFPDQVVTVTGEDWEGRYYLVFVRGPESGGNYYRFDTRERSLLRLFPAYGSLDQRKLAPRELVTYESRDGAAISAYLTRPEQTRGGPAPAVVLLRGSSPSADEWAYDFLTQFLAAEGYAVLRSDYRGALGYGRDWLDRRALQLGRADTEDLLDGAQFFVDAGLASGSAESRNRSGGAARIMMRWLGRPAFQRWDGTIGDILDGAGYLVEAGIADPENLCVIGWGHGGYAALLSAVEERGRFKCAISIAGVTDPEAVRATMRRTFAGNADSQTTDGADEDTAVRLSPVARADEFDVPVLLFHPVNDMDVPFSQGQSLLRALDRAGKDVELIEYENAEHSIRPQRYRIDMLTRVGLFLDRHIGG